MHLSLYRYLVGSNFHERPVFKLFPIHFLGGWQFLDAASVIASTCRSTFIFMDQQVATKMAKNRSRRKISRYTVFMVLLLSFYACLCIGRPLLHQVVSNPVPHPPLPTVQAPPQVLLPPRLRPVGRAYQRLNPYTNNSRDIRLNPQASRHHTPNNNNSSNNR